MCFFALAAPLVGGRVDGGQDNMDFLQVVHWRSTRTRRQSHSVVGGKEHLGKFNGEGCRGAGSCFSIVQVHVVLELSKLAGWAEVVQGSGVEGQGLSPFQCVNDRLLDGGLVMDLVAADMLLVGCGSRLELVPYHCNDAEWVPHFGRSWDKVWMVVFGDELWRVLEVGSRVVLVIVLVAISVALSSVKKCAAKCFRVEDLIDFLFCFIQHNSSLRWRIAMVVNCRRRGCWINE